MKTVKPTGRGAWLLAVVIVTTVACGQTEQQGIESMSAETTGVADGEAVDNSPTETMPFDRWLAEMDEICQRADQTVAATDSNDPEAFKERWTIRADGMRSLPRPAGREDAADDLLATLDEIVVTLDENDNIAGVLADLASPESEIGNRLNDLVAELELSDCGETEAEPTAFCDRITASMVADIVGAEADPTIAENLGAEGCEWEGPNGRLAVQTGTTTTYTPVLDIVRQSPNPIPNLGEEAYLVDGYSSVTGGGTRGQTVWVVDGDRTIAASIDVGEIEVGRDLLVEISLRLLAQ